MKKEKETFASLMLSFKKGYDLRTVFTDFIDAMLCSFSPDFLENGDGFIEFGRIISKYPPEDYPSFVLMMDTLYLDVCQQVEENRRVNDILGEFYEEHIRSDNEPPLPAWETCWDTAKAMVCNGEPSEKRSFIDPACKGGRLLLAMYAYKGTESAYFGREPDVILAKLAALTLFMNGVCKGEVVCDGETFVCGYRFSEDPWGIIKVTEKEQCFFFGIYHETLREMIQKKRITIRQPQFCYN